MEQIAPGGRRLPGRHALRKPARDRRRARHAAPARRRRVRRAGPAGARSRRGPRGGRARRRACPPARSPRPGCSPSSSPSRPAQLRGRQGVRPRRLRRLLPRDAGARASICRPRSSRPGSRRSRTATSTWSARSAPPGRCSRSCEPARRDHRGVGPRARGRMRWRSPGRGASRELDGVRGFVLEAVYEGYLMHYGEPRAFAGMDEDLRLLAGDALYALGSVAARRSGRSGGRGRALGPDLALRPGAGGGPARGRPRRSGSRVRRLWRPGRDRVPALVRSVTKLALPFAERKNP